MLRIILVLLIGIYVFGTTTVLQASNKVAFEHIKNFDVRFYNPINNGLNDLIVKVKVSNLKEILDNAIVYGKIKDVSFKIYWSAPGYIYVDVEGIPKSFRILNDQLRKLIMDRFDFIIPRSLYGQFKNFDFKVRKYGVSTKLEGLNKNKLESVTRAIMFLDNKGKLKELSTYSPSGIRKAKFELSPLSWSNNKWVLKEMNTSIRHGVQVTNINYKFEYDKEDGFGLLEELQMVTKKEIVNSGKIDKTKIVNIKNLTFEFSNYEINTKKAKKYLQKKGLIKQ